MCRGDRADSSASSQTTNSPRGNTDHEGKPEQRNDKPPSHLPSVDGSYSQEASQVDRVHQYGALPKSSATPPSEELEEVIRVHEKDGLRTIGCGSTSA